MTNDVEIFFEDVPQQQNVLNVSTSVNNSGESELIVAQQQNVLNVSTSLNNSGESELIVGLSAYQIAVNRGFVGTVEEWLLSLKGEKGDQGIQGERGASDTDAAMLEGQNGAFYLNRDNHTGTQAISTVSGLQTALDLKLDSADYNDRFLGLYASVFDLEAAHPTASAGDYAQVDWGLGEDVIVYVYDVSDAQWIPVGSSAIANTDALPEGSTNLYFTGQRVRDTTLSGLSTASATPITAADSVLSAAGKLQAQISAASSGSLQPAVGEWFCHAGLRVAATGAATILTLTQYHFLEFAENTTFDGLGVVYTTAAGRSSFIRFYNLATLQAVTPRFDAAHPNQGFNFQTFAPQTLPAGKYLLGVFLSGSGSVRRVIAANCKALPIIDPVLGVNSVGAQLGFSVNSTNADATLQSSISHLNLTPSIGDQQAIFIRRSGP